MQFRFAAAALAVVAILSVVMGGSQSVAANGATPDRSYQGLIGTKFNASAQPPAMHEAGVFGGYGGLESVLVYPTDAPSTGALSIDTSDLSVWRAPVPTGKHTWTLTTKAQSAESAGVYINGQFRPLKTGSKLIFKWIGNDLGTLYIKVTGSAPTGSGATRVNVESETKAPGMDAQLRVIVSEYPEGSQVSGYLSMGFGFSEPLGSIDESGVVLECGAGPIPITVNLLTMAIRIFAPQQVPGSSCTVTIASWAATDADTNDPPDTMAEDFVLNFEIAPLTVGFNFEDGGTLPTNTSLSIGFNLDVFVAAGAVTITGCSTTWVSAGPSYIFAFALIQPWVVGETCTVTVYKDLIWYVDANNQEHRLEADVVRTVTFVAP